MLGGALYISGAVLYMLKFPERLKPGLFDYIVILFMINSYAGMFSPTVPFLDSSCCLGALQSLNSVLPRQTDLLVP